MAQEHRKIKREFIDSLIQRATLSDIVGRYVKLESVGSQRYKACCPFHHEKTPSFHLSDDKGTYYCFGCKAKGNVLTFLKEYNGLDFIASVKELASLLSIPIEYEEDQRSKAQIEREQAIRAALAVDKQILQEAASLFHNALLNTPGAGQYLQQRGLTREMIDLYGLGYAPPGNALLSYYNDLVQQHQAKVADPLTHLLNVDLVRRSENYANSYYDTYRERITFPIYNVNGEIVGFGGRILNNDKSKAKYINPSNNSTVYDKSKELYGLYQVISSHRQQRKAIKRIILVEGYLDVISLSQFGIYEGVAASGTAIAKGQLQQIFRHAKSLVCCFDGDAAGYKAAAHAAQQMLSILHDDYTISFAFLQNGEDPDSYLKKYGVDEFNRFLNDTSLSLMDYLISHTKEELEKNNVPLADQARQALMQLTRAYAEIPADRAPNYRSDLTNKLIREFELDYNVLKGQLATAEEQYAKEQQEEKERALALQERQQAHTSDHYNSYGRRVTTSGRGFSFAEQFKSQAVPATTSQSSLATTSTTTPQAHYPKATAPERLSRLQQRINNHAQSSDNTQNRQANNIGTNNSASTNANEQQTYHNSHSNATPFTDVPLSEASSWQGDYSSHTNEQQGATSYQQLNHRANSTQSSSSDYNSRSNYGAKATSNQSSQQAASPWSNHKQQAVTGSSTPYRSNNSSSYANSVASTHSHSYPDSNIDEQYVNAYAKQPPSYKTKGTGTREFTNYKQQEITHNFKTLNTLMQQENLENASPYQRRKFEGYNPAIAEQFIRNGVNNQLLQKPRKINDLSKVKPYASVNSDTVNKILEKDNQHRYEKLIAKEAQHTKQQKERRDSQKRQDRHFMNFDNNEYAAKIMDNILSLAEKEFYPKLQALISQNYPELLNNPQPSEPLAKLDLTGAYPEFDPKQYTIATSNALALEQEQTKQIFTFIQGQFKNRFTIDTFTLHNLTIDLKELCNRISPSSKDAFINTLGKYYENMLNFELRIIPLLWHYYHEPQLILDSLFGSLPQFSSRLFAFYNQLIHRLRDCRDDYNNQQLDLSSFIEQVRTIIKEIYIRFLENYYGRWEDVIVNTDIKAEKPSETLHLINSTFITAILNMARMTRIYILQFADEINNANVEVTYVRSLCVILERDHNLLSNQLYNETQEKKSEREADYARAIQFITDYDRFNMKRFTYRIYSMARPSPQPMPNYDLPYCGKYGAPLWSLTANVPSLDTQNLRVNALVWQNLIQAEQQRIQRIAKEEQSNRIVAESRARIAREQEEKRRQKELEDMQRLAELQKEMENPPPPEPVFSIAAIQAASPLPPGVILPTSENMEAFAAQAAEARQKAKEKAALAAQEATATNSDPTQDTISSESIAHSSTTENVQTFSLDSNHESSKEVTDSSEEVLDSNRKTTTVSSPSTDSLTANSTLEDVTPSAQESEAKDTADDIGEEMELPSHGGFPVAVPAAQEQANPEQTTSSLWGFGFLEPEEEEEVIENEEDDVEPETSPLLGAMFGNEKE